MKKFIIFCLVLAILSLASTAAAQEKVCTCKKATKDQIPYGGNVLEELASIRLRRLTGTLVFPNGKPLENGVVEIFKVKKEDRDRGASEISAYNTRLAACWTGKDGKFCFPNIKSGTYVIRAGTGSPNGFNYVFLKVFLEKDNLSVSDEIKLFPSLAM